MLTSTCVKCSGTIFGLKVAEPKGSRMKVYFVQCAHCGGVAGVLPFFDTASLLDVMAKKMGIRDLLG